MSPHTPAALQTSAMAPSSLTCAFIIDGMYIQKGSEVRYNKARRLSLPPASVDEETSAMEQSAPSSPGSMRLKYEPSSEPLHITDGWALEMDEDSVERPEDICHLEIEWDLNVWNETQDHARTDDSGEPQKLFQDDASPSSAVEDDSA